MTIAEKVRHAKRAAENCPPLSNDNALWNVLMPLYAGPKQIRHSLI